MAPPRLNALRLLLLAVNIASTVLTVFTGLKENALLVYVTDKYGLVRSRLIEGRINYDLLRDDLVDRGMLVNLTQAGNSFRFMAAPRRSPANLGEDRSTCMRINSVNASMLAIFYDDFWGKGPRRIQVFAHSISAPRCKVINFKPDWVKSCIQTRANATECHRFILDNFDTLLDNRVVQVGKESDYGINGAPFLKCLGRPERTFDYVTDLLVQHSYWAGGSYHLELQSSKCLALPLLRNSDMKYGLFQTQQADQAADVCVGVDSSGWFASVVTLLYGLVSIVMIFQGVVAALLRSKSVFYLPKAARFLKEQRYLKYLLPSMGIATMLVEDEHTLIRFKGTVFMGSDAWLNHWLYIALSILEAIVNVRMTYVVYAMGTFMLRKQINIENFIFLCSALTRMTWLMCFLHSLLRLGTKLAMHSLKTLKLLRPALRHRIEWYVDASALFLNFKIYNLLMCAFLYTFLKVHGSPTLMELQVPSKRGVLGGSPGLANFWGNEIICDLLTILAFLTAFGLTIGSILMLTKFHFVADNGVIKLLQQRYVFVGWDVFVTMEALGIDPMNPKLVDADRGVATTNCSLGSILQQLYMSSPSGLVNLAGDYIFHDGGFSKEPANFSYPTKRAQAIGLVATKSARGSSSHSTKRTTYAPSTAAIRDEKAGASVSGVRARVVDAEQTQTQQTRKSIYDQQLHVYAESRFGKILLVDAAEPGKFCTNPSGYTEFVVRDALTTMSILDIKHLLGNEKKLRVV